MNEMFILSLAMMLTVIFRWAFRTLPRENWQIIAAMPVEKIGTGEWRGKNLTYYGFFTAGAYIFAVAIVFIMLGAVSVPVTAIFAIVALVLAICIPCSSVIAGLVEKKKHTFTIGGASFAGILLTPWIVKLADAALDRWTDMHLPVMPVLAALSVGYSFGEGLGRLACISFGCCYGKPLSRCPVWLQNLFEKRYFVFYGKTKKIAYAHGLDGEKIFPVQAITAVLYCISGLLGVYLFLSGYYRSAYIQTLAVTQLWRIFSEFLRADYRGNGRISAYQKMSMLAVAYAFCLLFILPGALPRQSDVLRGLGYLWNPLMILLLQGLWAAIFLHTGRSSVTGASISFHVVRERI
jgi:hypothetical protein